MFKIYSSVFLLALIGMFVLAFSFINIFCQFKLVSEENVMIDSSIVAIIFALICLGITVYIIKSEKKTKIGHWLNIHLAKLLLGYVLVLITFGSIKAEIFLTIPDIKNLISLEWGIMGISITIFLLWHVVAIDYLEKKKPINPSNDSPLKKALYLSHKEDFYSDVTLLLNNVYLLLINLVGLIYLTAHVYITLREPNIFSQCMVIVVLYLCTNTILSLIIDVLKPFNEKKKTMLEEAKTTKEDVDLQNAILKDAEDLLVAISVIEKIESLDEQDKKRMIAELVQKFTGTYSDTSNIKSLSAGDD